MSQKTSMTFAVVKEYGPDPSVIWKKPDVAQALYRLG